MLPVLAVEARIVLSVARDLYHTGGIEVDDGRRLATAVQRIERAVALIAVAEREVQR